MNGYPQKYSSGLWKFVMIFLKVKKINQVLFYFCSKNQ